MIALIEEARAADTRLGWEALILSEWNLGAEAGCRNATRCRR